jgi:hypothetical protein
MKKGEGNKCLYCGDPNCDLSCKPISVVNEFLILFIPVISLAALLYFCFIRK